MSAAEQIARYRAQMSEAQLQRAVTDLLTLFGWRWRATRREIAPGS